jgi:hypothetical protein
MNEEFLHYLWKNKLIFSEVYTTSGGHLVILNTGQHNTDSGPDFFNGRIKLGETTWAGNIEIHINSSDWYIHHHQDDRAYDSIILHVVFNDDKPIKRTNGEAVPTLELKNNFDTSIYLRYRSFLESDRWIPCEHQIGRVGHFQQYAWLDNLMIERLDQKAGLIEQELKKTNNDLQEVFYRKLARNFGFRTNADTFESLASSLPLKILSKHKSNLLQIESLLYGQAGMLKRNYKDDYPNELKTEYLFLAGKYNLKAINNRSWKFMRMRPSNFPTIRISQFSQIIYKSSGLLNQILEAKKLTDVVNLFQTETSPYWEDHFRFDKKSPKKPKCLGLSSIHLLLINTIIPFLFVYGKVKHDDRLQQKAVDWLELIKAEQNSITRKFSAIGLKPKNAMHSQALLQLKMNYCDYKRCLECRIGHELLRNQGAK